MDCGSKKRFSTQHLAKWLAQNPAKLIGKADSIGKIAKGHQANLIIWDPEKAFMVTKDIILHKHKITPYLNETLNGVVEQVFLKGKKVLENGQLIIQNAGEIILK